jgi:ABC-type transport system involved in cytochrome bd biosynthesis fused ATPase/permease subunit
MCAFGSVRGEIEPISGPTSDLSLCISLSLSIRYDAAAKDILKSFTYEFIRGDRVGVVGPSKITFSPQIGMIIYHK